MAELDLLAVVALLRDIPEQGFVARPSRDACRNSRARRFRG
jgi:hypothetical protein